MPLDAQVKELESSLDGLLKLGVVAPGSTLDRLRWLTTPREAELATAVLAEVNQSLKQTTQTLQHLTHLASQSQQG